MLGASLARMGDSGNGRWRGWCAEKRFRLSRGPSLHRRREAGAVAPTVHSGALGSSSLYDLQWKTPPAWSPALSMIVLLHFRNTRTETYVIDKSDDFIDTIRPRRRRYKIIIAPYVMKCIYYPTGKGGVLCCQCNPFPGKDFYSDGKERKCLRVCR